MDERTAAVARAIQAAFAGAARPSYIYKRDRRGPTWDVQGDAFYAARNAAFVAAPDPPSDAFLDANGVMVRELAVDAAAWYWGALLPRALANPDQLLHGALYWLRPNPCDVLVHGGDAELEAMRDAMSGPQRAAVAQFLALVIETSTTHRRRLAAQCVSWCWRIDAATTAAAERFFAAERAFVRPPAETPEQEALIVAIESAFADTPIPTEDLVTVVDEETAEYVLDFRGTRWQCLTPDFINGHHAAWSFFKEDAFRAYLPAMLRGSLLGLTGVNPIFHLVNCVMDPSSYRERSRGCMRRLSAPERAAVIAYLRHQAAADSGDAEIIQVALRDFWLTLDDARG